jgi:glycosidase
MKKYQHQSLLVIALLFWSGIYGAANYKINHLEPPFWWTGMKSPHLQLLIHGEGISDLSPELDFPGVTLLEITRVQNPNYLFVNLYIRPEADPGSFDIQFKKGDETVISYNYKLKEREPGSAMRQGFNQSDALYLISPDRFANGNPSNDQVEYLAEKPNRSFPGGRHGGDIRGIIDHLDYIDEMGFTSIWLNPLLENDMEEYSYHGYSTTDFYNVDARFGSNQEYLELSDAASDKGIGVIMDMIVNHCGSEHWWMDDMPMDNWINFNGKFSPTSHNRTTVQDNYASREDLKHFNDGWFVATMPDLNQRNPLMANYLIQNSIWWVEYAGLTGIRMDTYPYSDKHFLTQWTKRIMEEYPDFNIVGEEWSVNPVVVSYWQRGKDNKDDYVSYLPSLMDFPLQNAMSSALREEETWGSGFVKLYEMLANDVLYADPYNLVVFGDNHDMSRIYTQLDDDFGLFKMAMAYVLTTRGIPQVLY